MWVIRGEQKRSARHDRKRFPDFYISAQVLTQRKHNLLQRASDLGLNTRLILGMRDYLSSLPQRVCASGMISDLLGITTGGLQDCVSSTLLLVDKLKYDATPALLQRSVLCVSEADVQVD